MTKQHLENKEKSSTTMKRRLVRTPVVAAAATTVAVTLEATAAMEATRGGGRIKHPRQGAQHLRNTTNNTQQEPILQPLISLLDPK